MLANVLKTIALKNSIEK